MSGRFVIHSAVDLRLLAWSAAETDNGWDRMVQRKDRYSRSRRIAQTIEHEHDERGRHGGQVGRNVPEIGVLPCETRMARKAAEKRHSA